MTSRRTDEMSGAVLAGAAAHRLRQLGATQVKVALTQISETWGHTLVANVPDHDAAEADRLFAGLTRALSTWAQADAAVTQRVGLNHLWRPPVPRMVEEGGPGMQPTAGATNAGRGGLHRPWHGGWPVSRARSTGSRSQLDASPEARRRGTVMNGRRIVGMSAALAVVAAAAWVGVAVATAGGDSASPRLEQTMSKGGWPAPTVSSVAAGERLAAASAVQGRTLTLLTRPVREADVDVPPRGFSPGDFFIFEEAVFNRNANRVGEDSGRCEVGIRTFTCEATVKVNGKGKIRIAGSLFDNRDSTFPITGGTGRYNTAAGSLTVFDLRGGRGVLVFNLTR